MEEATKFRSEAFKDGQTYVYDASADGKQWTATIWDAQGKRHGDISCEYLGPPLAGEELEDAVNDWVHEAIRCGVGIF